MRVIKHGDLFEIGQITCKRCNCEIAYTRQDIEQIKETNCENYTRGGDIKNIVMCPECHATIGV